MSTPPGRENVDRPATEAEVCLEILENLVKCDLPDNEAMSSGCLTSFGMPRLSGGGINI